MKKVMFNEINSLLEATSAETDRGLALSMSAFMDDSLASLLKKYLKSCRTANELIEGSNAPLCTFSSRAKLVYCLGLLSKKQFNDIDLILQIRNKFAHNWNITSFEHQVLQPYIEALSLPNFMSPDKGPLTKHQKFQYVSCEILISLEFNCGLVKRQGDFIVDLSMKQLKAQDS